MSVRSPGVEVELRPATRLRGELQLPGDKSIAHRALLFNALADGPATVTLREPGDDVRSTLACLRALGVEVGESREGPVVRWRLDGSGMRADGQELDCGNSGTTMRLLAGLLASRPGSAWLTGDASLGRRPMERVAAPLRAMGAEVATTEGRAPLRVAGAARLRALEHRLPVASAQLIGAISLAALAADGETRIVSPGPTRDHTERLLAAMGVAIRREELLTAVNGPGRPHALNIQVPGDPSAAAAWLVAGASHPDARIRLRNVCLNPTRLAIVEVLGEMGARIEVEAATAEGPEPVGDLVVESGGHLRAVRLDGNRAAELIDELPVLAVAMAGAEGVSEVRDAAELRVKESDRVASVTALLEAIGADVEELPDGWRIARGTPRTAEVQTAGDHRIAMAAAVAAISGVAASVRVDDPDCVNVSYRSFWSDLALLTEGEA